MRNHITKHEVEQIRNLVINHYGYVDEWVESSVLFIIEYALGMHRHCIPDEWMIRIIDNVFE